MNDETPPQPGQTCYNTNGRAATMREHLKDGSFLVLTLLRVDTGEHGEQDVDGELEIWQNASTKPPVHKISEEIVALNAQKDAIYRGIREAREEERAVKQALKDRMAIITRHEKLKLLEDFLEGRITHYVAESWTSVDILPLPVHVVCDRDDDRRNMPLRLLCLYGDSKGDLTWKLSPYSSPSYQETHVYPFTSEADAKAKATELLHAKCGVNFDEGLLKNADRLGIELPAGYREGVAQMLADRKQKQIDELKQKIETLAQ